MFAPFVALLLFAPAGSSPARDPVHPATRAYVGPREVALPPGADPGVAVDPTPSSAPDPGASTTPSTPPTADAHHEGERPSAPAMTRSADETLVRRVTRPGDSDVRRTWVVGGFVDASYVINSNSPDNHINRGMGTAPRSGEFGVPLAVAYIRHDADRREPWFLELALQVGPAATSLLAADPQPGGDASRLAGVNVWQHLGRANAGIRIPRARTEIGGGVFGTPISYWSFWAKDNWTYSTPWHLNAVPYVLMGLRVLQPIGRKWLLQAWVHNGWATYADINKAPSYLGGAIVEPVAGLHLGQFFHFGPEDTDIRARAWRMLSDTWMAFERGRFGLVAIADVMRERVTAQPGEPVAMYLAGAISPRVRVLERRGGRIAWWLAARGEAFWDRHGRIYGVDQLMGSAVASSDLRLFEFVQLRVEYRFDASTAPQGFFYRGAAVHDSDGGLAQQQHAVYIALIGTFEHWFGRRARSK